MYVHIPVMLALLDTRTQCLIVALSVLMIMAAWNWVNIRGWNTRGTWLKYSNTLVTHVLSIQLLLCF